MEQPNEVVQMLEEALALAKRGELGREVILIAHVGNGSVRCFWRPAGIGLFMAHAMLGVAIDLFRQVCGLNFHVSNPNAGTGSAN